MISDHLQRINCNEQGQMIFDTPSLFSFFYRRGSYMVHLYDSKKAGEKRVVLTGFPGRVPFSNVAGSEARKTVQNIVSRSRCLCGIPFYESNLQMVLFSVEEKMGQKECGEATPLLVFVARSIIRVWPVLIKLQPYLVFPAGDEKRGENS